MAKTIKFNLICDGKSIRTIEDLQENFSVEDILKYYENGLLLRWLKVRGYEEEYIKVLAIASQEKMEVIKELIQIFQIETNEEKIEENIYILQYLEERETLFKTFEQDNFKVDKIINEYSLGYRKLVDTILKNPDDVGYIKATIAEIVANYRWVLKLDHRELFWKLTDVSPLTIMCLLMNADVRDFYLPLSKEIDENVDPFAALAKVMTSMVATLVPEPKESYRTYEYTANWIKKSTNIIKQQSSWNELGEKVPFRYIDNDIMKSLMYNQICEMIKKKDFKERMGKNIHIFSGTTEEYWKDIAEKGKKYMIISMGEGDYVRSAGALGGDLSKADIEDKFVILDGIDYKSNKEDNELLYMEV